MAEARFDLLGGQELEVRLVKLAGIVQKKLMRRAVAKAARPMRKTARALVPRETGLLRKSIGIKMKLYKRSGTQTAIIGARVNFKEEGRNPVKYAHLVEGGTKPHAQPGFATRDGYVIFEGGRHPGASPKRFLEPAFDQHKRQAFDIMKTQLHADIQKEAAKR